MTLNVFVVLSDLSNLLFLMTWIEFHLHSLLTDDYCRVNGDR